MESKVYEIITDTIIKKLEEGTVPWHKPWSGAANAPKNLISKKEYNGINTFLLACSGYESPYWLTLKQANELGGKIKAGEKSTMVVYWNWIEKTDDTGKVVDKIPFLRYYRVFNLSQCEGIPENKIPAGDAVTLTEHEKIEACESIVESMPERPTIRHDEQRAYYSPSQDFVNMPQFQSFHTPQGYYSVLFHELTHSTGHDKRVGRDDVCGPSKWASFGSTPYAKEELVAEMGAAFLCGHTGIENKTIDNSAAYIASWLTKLRNDKKMVVNAAAQAQKAANYILAKN